MFPAVPRAARPAEGGCAPVLRLRATRPAPARASAGPRATSASSLATACARSRPCGASMASALAGGRAAPAGPGAGLAPRPATARGRASGPAGGCLARPAPGERERHRGAPGAATAFLAHATDPRRPQRRTSGPATRRGVQEFPDRPAVLPGAVEASPPRARRDGPDRPGAHEPLATRNADASARRGCREAGRRPHARQGSRAGPDAIQSKSSRLSRQPFSAGFAGARQAGPAARAASGNLRYTTCCVVRGQGGHKLWTRSRGANHPQVSQVWQSRLSTPEIPQ